MHILVVYLGVFRYKRQGVRLSFTFLFSNFTLTNLSNTISRQRIGLINVKLWLKSHGDLYAICLSCFSWDNIQFHERVCKLGSILRHQTTMLKFVFRYPPKSITRDVFSLFVFYFQLSFFMWGDTPLNTTGTPP